MMDQINSLSKQGNSACRLDYNCQSGQTAASVEDSSDEEDTAKGESVVNVPLDDIIKGKYSLVYAHPEAFLRTTNGTAILSAFKSDRTISCIAVDDAHMILER
ncbi:hypothetical protein DPMN_186034 [Dreissena polymorpha]|uniref:Uncharacterized protein n=1 Tax=Dreissena polymorpha TaxID=45954 RepID=A0A9D4DND9_DREPO|nr:hypothetical protein DPMN_186034 [Dreissena polymorpha]